MHIPYNTYANGAGPPSPRPKFGCRMFAYMAPKQGEDTFIRQCLLSGGNSIQRQNQLPFGEPGDPEIPAAPHHTEANLLNLDSPYPIKTGWGIAAFSPNPSQAAPALFKNELPTFEDEAFVPTAQQIANEQPAVILTHLRESRTKGTSAEVHPFRIQNWAFMHHGDLSNQIARELREELETRKEQKKPIILPKGKSDSELIACYFASQLLAEAGTADTRKIQDKQLIERLFRQLVTRLSQWPRRESVADIMTTIERNGQGENHPGSLNFVFSDGTRLLASNCITIPNTPQPSYLHLGKRHAANGTEYVLATYPMQPTEGQRIQWRAIPNHSILKLERHGSGEKSSIAVEEWPIAPASQPKASQPKKKPGFFQKVAQRAQDVLGWLTSRLQRAWNWLMALFAKSDKGTR